MRTGSFFSLHTGLYTAGATRASNQTRARVVLTVSAAEPDAPCKYSVPGNQTKVSVQRPRKPRDWHTVEIRDCHPISALRNGWLYRDFLYRCHSLRKYLFSDRETPGTGTPWSSEGTSPLASELGRGRWERGDVSATVRAPSGDVRASGVYGACLGCASGPFLWYTPHRRTGGGNGRNNRAPLPETSADTAAERRCEGLR